MMNVERQAHGLLISLRDMPVNPAGETLTRHAEPMLAP